MCAFYKYYMKNNNLIQHFKCDNMFTTWKM